MLIFLPLALLCYYRAAASRALRLGVILVFSTVFYAWWDPRFAPLLLATVVVNWSVARLYERVRAPAVIVAGVALNLALLALFKYADFLAQAVLALAGVRHQPWSLILPLGISFVTFQHIVYLVDLKRGRAPRYSLLEYAAYVCFFPHLIAGPIIRHHQLIGQFDAPPLRAGWQEGAARGAVLFVLGLLKKVFFADELAGLADHGFAAAGAGTIAASAAWLAAGAYSLQLYFDFSAYSDMAIGLGAMFGFRFPLNFDDPYRARNIREFWRRWHMTLSAFFRDYVYIPMGGSRRTLAGTCVIVMVTMLLCGLWHGAGWTFVAWGGLHGLAICADRVWMKTGLTMPAVVAWALTLVFVIAGWVLFRAADFPTAATMLAAMAGRGAEVVGSVDPDDVVAVLIGAGFALAGPTNVRLVAKPWIPRRAVAFATAFGLVAAAMRVGQGRGLEFIYFQF